VTDGSSLYPTVLAAVWPQAAHQLCVFHVLKDLNKHVLNAVRRVHQEMQRRGQRGRQRKPGQPKKGSARSRLSDLMEMAFSKRDSVGWLARSSSSIERPATSLKTGSDRRVSWSFWSS